MSGLRTGAPVPEPVEGTIANKYNRNADFSRVYEEKGWKFPSVAAE